MYVSSHAEVLFNTRYQVDIIKIFQPDSRPRDGLTNKDFSKRRQRLVFVAKDLRTRLYFRENFVSLLMFDLS